MNEDVRRVMRNILEDIRVELGEEFDKNFDRQAFFSESWQRRKSPGRKDGALLIDSGDLRKSILSRTTEDSITFYTTLPYAEIHNDGGEIVVSKRMKGYFWHKYQEAVGAFTRKKDGTVGNSKRNRKLSEYADFYKAMALKKVGSTIKIPRRRFLGTSPEVEAMVRDIVERNIEEYMNIEFDITKK